MTPEEINERHYQFVALEALGLVKRHDRPDGSADVEVINTEHPAVIAFSTKMPCSQADFLDAVTVEELDQVQLVLTARLEAIRNNPTRH